MRVVRDGFAHVDSKTGQRLHTKVRVMVDDTGRVAVFLNPNAGPQHVYQDSEVVLTKQGGNCSHPVCHGKASKQKLTRLWAASETVSV